MVLNLRAATLCALAVALVPAVRNAGGAQPRATPSPPAARAVAGGVWLIPGGIRPNREPDGNTVIFDAAPGLVVMDTGRHAWHRQAILDFVRSRNERIVAIVNSHWHLDHVSGNPALKLAYPGARVYASRAIDDALTGFLARSVAQGRHYLASRDVLPETADDVRADIATVENGAALRPDVRVDATQPVRFGTRTLDLNLAPNAATAGDVWVYDAATGVAAVGDLVTLPAAFLDTACPDGWRAALDAIWSTPFTTLVPGHGMPMTRPEFASYRRAFSALIGCARSDAAATACAAQWTDDVRPLLGPDAGDERRARSMTEYYVSEVLRARDGCSSASRAHRS